MGPARRTWFIAPRAPNFDCSPGGYLGLGGVISDPFRPDRPLSPGPPPALPDYVRIEKATKVDWKRLTEKSRQGELRIWAQFLQCIGIESLGAEWKNVHTDQLQSAEVEISWCNPPLSFLKERTDVKEVVEYATSGHFKKLYMITAIMIARDSSVQQLRDHSWAAHTKFGVDLTAVGAPGVSVGPDLRFSPGSKTQTSAAGSSDFVFAYRLSKIVYKKKAGVTKLSEKPYTRGAAFDTSVRAKQDDDSVYVDLDSLELRDLTSEELALDSVPIDDGSAEDGESECVLPE